MKLIVISPPNTIDLEYSIVDDLFKEGLERYHIRKPNATRKELITYLNSIHPEYRRRVVLHSHFDLAMELGLGGIHLREKERREMEEEQIQALAHRCWMDNQTISTSVHRRLDLYRLSHKYEYAFASPVFDSISKKGYKASWAWTKPLDQVMLPCETIALGGIDADKIFKAKRLGYHGVALMGAIWQEPNRAITNFIHILRLCHESVRMS